ncbi:hypothetical protein [Microvirga vignae]|nr:hypothetical protein [Microvirga vignae]
MKQQAVGVRSPRLLDASAKFKASVQDIPVRQARTSDEPSNPIYLLAAITIGIPILLMIPLVGMNPGVQEGMLATLTMFSVFSAFLAAAVFEIKRLADQPSDAEHHQGRG